MEENTARYVGLPDVAAARPVSPDTWVKLKTTPVDTFTLHVEQQYGGQAALS